MRTLLLFLTLLLGAAPPEATPAAPPPTDAPTGEAAPAPEPAPDAAPAPEVAPAAAPSGEEVLARAVSALTAGDYDTALAIAFPSISAFPELAPSFRAIVDVAADQIERRRIVEAQPHTDPVAAAEHAPPMAGQAPTAYPQLEAYRAYRREGRRTKLLWGFDAGFPTGLRLEWKIARSTVDSFGLRVGGNSLFYGRLYAVADVTTFMDFKLSQKWQIEAVAGTLVYYGWIYPQAGVAAQYDPPSPLHVNVGGRLSLYGSVMPDVSVGFVW